MRNIRVNWLLIWCLSIILTLGSLNASSVRNVGFACLKIPVGTAIGGIAGTATAFAEGATGIVYNPASSARINSFSIQVDYMRWFLDTKQQSAFVVRNLNYLSIGAGIVSFTAGKLEYRENRPTEEPLGTFSPIDITGYINISRAISDQVDFGTNIRIYHSKIFSYQTTGLGADIGLRFLPFKDLNFGVAIVDISRPLSYKYERFLLPTRGKIGIAYRLKPTPSVLTAVIDGVYFFHKKELEFTAGLDWRVADLFSLRAGFAPFNSTSKLTVGAGIHRGLFRIDYSYLPLNFHLGTAHRFGISIGY